MVSLIQSFKPSSSNAIEELTSLKKQKFESYRREYLLALKSQLKD